MQLIQDVVLLKLSTNCMYQYKAKVVNVYDGDTITVDIDLGLKVWVRDEKLRLYGINAPELKGKERDKGLESRDHLRDILPTGSVITIRTIKDKKGKYGRYLAEIFVDDVNVNEKMVDDGFAVFKKY